MTRIDKDLVQEAQWTGEDVKKIVTGFAGSAFHRVVFPHSAVFQFLFLPFTHDVPPPPRVPSMSLEYLVCGTALSTVIPPFSTTLHFYLFINGTRDVQLTLSLTKFEQDVSAWRRYHCRSCKRSIFRVCSDKRQCFPRPSVARDPSVCADHRRC